MQKVKVIVVGDSPFVDEVGRLCAGAGHQVAALAADGSLIGLAEADVVVEMCHDSAETKQRLLRAISAAARPDALILTSALPVSATLAASWVTDPRRVAGFAVLPPLTDTGMVELAQSLTVAPETLTNAARFWQSLGYDAVTVGDGPGLVRARVVCCLINEACTALSENVASPADIDLAMQLGTNYPHGPLAWGDLLGLDAVLGVMTGLFDEWGEDRYRPNPLLKRMVAAGQLGRKSGQGFFSY
jgi:3-hydroxybutyryl-CoA dehydrogenase